MRYKDAFGCEYEVPINRIESFEKKRTVLLILGIFGQLSALVTILYFSWT